MNSFLSDSLISNKAALAVVGLGYVGLPLAAAFAEKGIQVIGFDNNVRKIELYKAGIDPTKEIGDDKINRTAIQFTSDERELENAQFIIIAVPTPVNADHTPDLSPVINASVTVGKNMKPGTLIVYESTVYPGVTEDVCVPVLEKQSGLICGTDFKIGYSPERINPGDKIHCLTKIQKIVSGMDTESCEEIKRIYDLVIEAGTFPVSSIKTAEAVKIAENSQRDINIAFMNELAMVFERMGIDTNEVVDGMNTKWNALRFRPGLVGGHCIGVDPYYFTYEAEKLGYHSQIILNGRIVNDSMGAYIADAAVRKMTEAGLTPKKSKAVILGLSFKENCPDIRNSKVYDVVKRLNQYGIEPVVTDSWADQNEAQKEYGIELVQLETIHDADCVVIAVAHNEFKKLGISKVKRMFRQNQDDKKKVLLDVKGIFSIAELEESGLNYWRL